MFDDELDKDLRGRSSEYVKGFLAAVTLVCNKLRIIRENGEAKKAAESLEKGQVNDG